MFIVSKLGAGTLVFFEEFSSMIWMAKETVSELIECILAGRVPCHLDQLFFQTNRVGVGSVPIIVLVSVFVGLTMALLTGYQLQIFGVVVLVPAVVSIAFTREMGPLFTGIVLAARIGAAYTAELGSMTASEEVDALEGMGIGPLRYLVIPRFLAILCLTPCLAIVSTVAAIFGGALISGPMLGLNFSFFYDQVFSNLLVKDILSGVAKSFLFGGLIGWIACYKGLVVKGGAAGVGIATTSSVVISISTVIACDSLCNIIMVTLFP